MRAGSVFSDVYNTSESFRGCQMQGYHMRHVWPNRHLFVRTRGTNLYFESKSNIYAS